MSLEQTSRTFRSKFEQLLIRMESMGKMAFQVLSPPPVLKDLVKNYRSFTLPGVNGNNAARKLSYLRTRDPEKYLFVQKGPPIRLNCVTDGVASRVWEIIKVSGINPHTHYRVRWLRTTTIVGNNPVQNLELRLIYPHISSTVVAFATHPPDSVRKRNIIIDHTVNVLIQNGETGWSVTLMSSSKTTADAFCINEFLLPNGELYHFVKGRSVDEILRRKIGRRKPRNL